MVTRFISWSRLYHLPPFSWTLSDRALRRAENKLSDKASHLSWDCWVCLSVARLAKVALQKLETDSFPVWGPHRDRLFAVSSPAGSHQKCAWRGRRWVSSLSWFHSARRKTVWWTKPFQLIVKIHFRQRLEICYLRQKWLFKLMCVHARCRLPLTFIVQSARSVY